MTNLAKPPQVFIESLAARKIPLRMTFVTSASDVTQLPIGAAPEFALVGRSNVGKSSLLNFVAGQKQLARVSSTPGRTQLINIFDAEKGMFTVADLPGYGFALSPRETQAHWQTAMADYFNKRDNLVAVLFLMDARRDINEEDAHLARYLLSLGLTLLGVQTKVDKVHKSELAQRRIAQARSLGIAPGMVVATSAEKKQGLEPLFVGLSGILEGLDGQDGDAGAPPPGGRDHGQGK